MTIGVRLACVLAIALPLQAAPSPACCPTPPISGMPVVNADQTVILIWDAATKTEHFIRRASFKSESADFGFLIPSPAEPELSESGDEAFPYLKAITEPKTVQRSRPWHVGFGCGLSEPFKSASLRELPPVSVLSEKDVAGFHAVVLDARSASALTGWLKDHGYAYSPEVEAWAKPYVEAGWKITALKVAKAKDAKDGPADDKKTVAAASLRMSFKTDRPLFPYREPDFKSQPAQLGVKDRLLRIYFLADAKYNGDFGKDGAWTGKIAYAQKLGPIVRTELLRRLDLPATTGPAEWWLTEFEDHWPYRVAPADVVFSRDRDQRPVERPPIVQYVAAPAPADITIFAIAAVLVVPLFWRRLRRRVCTAVSHAPRA